MKLTRVLLLSAALGMPVVLATPASAEPCALVYGLPFDGAVIACVNEGDCLVYQHSDSQIHIQRPICVTLR